MDLCLVAAPIVTEFGYAADLQSQSVLDLVYYPHLGVLSLAGTIAKQDKAPAIVNLNRLYYDYVTRQTIDPGSLARDFCVLDDFERHAVETLLAIRADIYGFSSICSTYPLTVRLAKGLRQANPECTILFGGPQASVVDRQTLAAFPFVDFVLRGEAEETLPMLLSELADGRRFGSIPGLTHRSPFGITRNGTPPVIENLDLLPTPDYSLEGGFVPLTRAALEAGRGCPFDCTFCSTNDFFRRRFRMKSPERIVEEMRALSAMWGYRDFDLTHDMFTVDRRKVAAFSEAMIAAGDGYGWSCSARSDFVDEELMGLMSRAGCKGLFFGIESGSVRIQRIMRKELDPARAKRVIAFADRQGINTTVSLIMGFPEETWQDIEDSIDIFVLALRGEHSFPQYEMLAPLAETPLYTHRTAEPELDELCSDMSHQGRRQSGADRDLILKHPDIFPNFYLLPTPHLERAALMELREFIRTMADGNRLRWLLVALHRATGGLLGVFFEWRQYRMRLRPDLQAIALREYYIGRTSTDDFVAFLPASGIGFRIRRFLP